MELQRIEEFVIIAKHSSIKKAAAELHLTPATLSSRLSTFEKSLGTVLFERNNISLTMTESGKRFYVDALDIINQYHTIKNELCSFVENKYQHLRIAVTGSGLPFYLGPFLDIINQKHPDIRLDIVDDNYCSIEEGLTDDKVDLYFAYAMNQVNYEGIARYPLANAHHYIILPSYHRLASKSSISLKELDHERFVLYPDTRETCIHDFQLENLKVSGIRYTTYDTDSSSAFYELLVPLGKGLLLTPIQAVREPPNCVSLSITDITYPAPLSLFYRKKNVRPETYHFVTEFIQFIKENSTNDHRKAI